ncbi:MAG: hypothetical protein Q9165_006671 [Trypethelium subeluteriae]
MGRIINAEFGSDDDEVLMWTEFGASLTIWDLRTGKSIEIRDPKFHNSSDMSAGEEGYGSAYKPVRPTLDDEEDGCEERPSNSKIFACLSRVGPRDVLSIHAAQTYDVISSNVLPSIDAKGLKWSPDGRWLTIWEAPSQGMRIWIYTADGHLFRSYTGTDAKDLEDAELGIRRLEWSPSGDWLALGGFERRVTLLNTRTFAPLLHLDHTPHIHLPVSSRIYVESRPSSTTPQRSYSQASQPYTLPTAVSFTPFNRANPLSTSSEAYSPSGISHLAFNPTSTLLATLSPAHPSTLWVWDLRHLCPRVVVVQSQPIKRISWAPNRPGLLLIQCRVSEPVVYLWDAEGLPAATGSADNLETSIASEIEEDMARRIEAPPQILHLPLDKRGASSTARRLEATWLPRRSTQVPAFVFGDPASFIVVRPRGSDPNPEAEEDDSTTRGPETNLDSQGKHLPKQRVHVEAAQSGGSSASSRPLTPGDDDSEDSLYEILTGRSPVRLHPVHGRYEGEDGGETMQIAQMVDAEEGEDDFTRMDDTFAGRKGMSFSDDSEIF